MPLFFVGFFSGILVSIILVIVAAAAFQAGKKDRDDGN